MTVELQLGFALCLFPFLWLGISLPRHWFGSVSEMSGVCLVWLGTISVTACVSVGLSGVTTTTQTARQVNWDGVETRKFNPGHGLSHLSMAMVKEWFCSQLDLRTHTHAHTFPLRTTWVV